jgi:hypothetical protein
MPIRTGHADHLRLAPLVLLVFPLYFALTGTGASVVVSICLGRAGSRGTRCFVPRRAYPRDNQRLVASSTASTLAVSGLSFTSQLPVSRTLPRAC